MCLLTNVAMYPSEIVFRHLMSLPSHMSLQIHDVWLTGVSRERHSPFRPREKQQRGQSISCQVTFICKLLLNKSAHYNELYRCSRKETHYTFVERVEIRKLGERNLHEHKANSRADLKFACDIVEIMQADGNVISFAGNKKINWANCFINRFIHSLRLSL